MLRVTVTDTLYLCDVKYMNTNQSGNGEITGANIDRISYAKHELTHTYAFILTLCLVPNHESSNGATE